MTWLSGANHQSILQSVALPFTQEKLGMVTVVYSFISKLGMGQGEHYGQEGVHMALALGKCWKLLP